MELRSYETMFVMTPVLSEVQARELVDKFRGLLQEKQAEIVHEAKIGLKRLAYPIQHQSTGVYHLFEFKATPDLVAALATAYKREDKVIRFSTFALDKHGVAYNEKKRSGVWDKNQDTKDKKAKVA